jgi:hypothetical protein
MLYNTKTKQGNNLYVLWYSHEILNTLQGQNIGVD